MELLNVFLTALFSVVLLYVITKVLGNKQLSQLSMFDYITGISIGSIAAEMATSFEDDILEHVIAMAVYGGIAFLTSFLTCKSLIFRKIVTGKALFLFMDGKLYYDNLMSAKLDINEFLMLLRNQGYFNLADIESVVFESNGQLSVLPKTARRPVCPADMQLSPETESYVANIIIDGKPMTTNLRLAGRDLKWLNAELKRQHCGDISNISLATLDNSGNVSVYTKIKGKHLREPFE